MIFLPYLDRRVIIEVVALDVEEVVISSSIIIIAGEFVFYVVGAETWDTQILQNII